LTCNGEERDAIGGGFWQEDQPQTVRLPGTQRLDGLLRGDGRFDSFFRCTSINARYFLKELHMKLYDLNKRSSFHRLPLDSVYLRLEGYSGFARLTGHPSPNPLDPTAGYGGWYLP
jgi:hypothetical protein